MKKVLLIVLESLLFFMIGVAFGHATSCTPVHGHEVTGRATDMTQVTVVFDATITKKFAFAPDITSDLQKFVISSSAKEALTEVKAEELRRDMYTLGFPLREALNRQLEFYGYKATDVKIISVKTERTCNGKVCRP